jgi:hypothetical protein
VREEKREEVCCAQCTLADGMRIFAMLARCSDATAPSFSFSDPSDSSLPPCLLFSLSFSFGLGSSVRPSAGFTVIRSFLWMNNRLSQLCVDLYSLVGHPSSVSF